jgi:hypothetical protein
MVLVAHDRASAGGRLDMEPGSRASFVCHRSPAASGFGVAAQELTPADGHEPKGLRAQAPLAISAGADGEPRALTGRLADRAPRQRAERGRSRRGGRVRRVRHGFPLGGPSPSQHIAGPGRLITRGGSASALPGQTWSGRSGRVQTEAPNQPSPDASTIGARSRAPRGIFQGSDGDAAFGERLVFLAVASIAGFNARQGDLERQRRTGRAGSQATLRASRDDDLGNS